MSDLAEVEEVIHYELPKDFYEGPDDFINGLADSEIRIIALELHIHQVERDIEKAESLSFFDKLKLFFK
jgi:hypothetical protein